MIIAEQKPFQSIMQNLGGYNRVLILGCGTCVTVCMAGGEKEVGILAEQIRLHQRELPEAERYQIVEATIERQCDREFFTPVEDSIKDSDCVLSMACGVGVQHISEIFTDKIVLPALDTKFFGATEEPGIWAERCAGCGSCILDLTGGICPVARCSKSLFNGPCGGSQEGACEISRDVECAWQLIYDRLKTLGRLDDLEKMIEIKDWTSARDGGPRKVVREDVKA
jgi:ferredoxin